MSEYRYRWSCLPKIDRSHPVVKMFLYKRVSNTVEVVVGDTPMKTMGRRKAVRLLLDHAANDDFIYIEEFHRDGDTFVGVFIYEKTRYMKEKVGGMKEKVGGMKEKVGGMKE